MFLNHFVLFQITLSDALLDIKTCILVYMFMQFFIVKSVLLVSFTFVFGDCSSENGDCS